MISLDLSGRLALVTGAGGGLGRTICLDLASCGADIALACNRSTLEAEKTAAEISATGRRALVVQGDVTDSEAVRRMVEKVSGHFGRSVDILVNNAGYYKDYAPVTEVSDEVLDRTIDTNLKGTFHVSREIGKAMIEAGVKGRIVNISSGAGHGGREAHAHYCASKAGIVMMTKAMAIEMAPKGININSISVGFVDVGRFDEGSLLAVKRDILPRILLRKAGKPQDISRMVCYLASDCGDWITGADFRIDGGESAGRIPWEN